MKADDRIFEILAEYLQKTDRILDRLEKNDRRSEKTDRNIDIMSKAILENSIYWKQASRELQKHSERFDKHMEALESMRKDSQDLRKETQDLRKESQRLEAKSDVSFKEMIALSKRVGRLEDEKGK